VAKGVEEVEEGWLAKMGKVSRGDARRGNIKWEVGNLIIATSV
jgi:hypothetical protein